MSWTPRTLSWTSRRTRHQTDYCRQRRAFFGGFSKITAERIDVDSATPLVASKNAQFLATAAIQKIHKHSFDTGLVEIVVFAK